MKLSICIPTWNRVERLEECLNNIIKQVTNNESNIEIIISDNGSTDTTESMIRQSITKHNFLKYFKNQDNIGFDRNFLKLIEYASGDYIFFCSDDDIVLDGTIEKIIKLINVEKEFSLVSLNYYSFKGKNHNVKYAIYKRSSEDIYFKNPDEHIKFVSYNLGFISSIVINRRESVRILNEESIYNYIDSGFVQIYLMLIALLTRKQSAWIGSFCIAQRTDTGGWFPLKFFGYELPRIYWECQKKGYSKTAVFKVVNDALFGLVLPGLIAWRCNFGDEEVNKSKHFIINSHAKNPLFWIFVYPFYIIPNQILKIPFRVLRSIKRYLKGVQT